MDIHSLEHRINVARSWAKEKKMLKGFDVQARTEGIPSKSPTFPSIVRPISTTDANRNCSTTTGELEASSMSDVEYHGTNTFYSTHNRPIYKENIATPKAAINHQLKSPTESSSGEEERSLNSDIDLDTRRFPSSNDEGRVGVGEDFLAQRTTMEPEVVTEEPMNIKDEPIDTINIGPLSQPPPAPISYAGLMPRKRSQIGRPNEFAPPRKQRRDARSKHADNVRILQAKAKGKPTKGFREQVVPFMQTYEEIGRTRADLDAGKNCEERLQTLRNCLQRISVSEHSTSNHFKDSRLDKPDKGLKSLFKVGSPFPFDLQADAKALYFLLDNGIYNMSILRGIKVATKITDGKSHTSSSLDGSTTKMNCAQYGMNHLVNGQWWPSQLSCCRDGAHGTPEGGIHGNPSKGGAYSIILADAYEDEDNGDIIEYCGTAGSSAGEPTRNTECMKQSLRSGNDVRVIRSHGMRKGRRYRPERGFRLDGVYKVVDQDLVHVDTSMWRFTLHRVPGQDPIRFTGPGKRPNPWEVAAFDQMKK